MLILNQFLWGLRDNSQEEELLRLVLPRSQGAVVNYFVHLQAQVQRGAIRGNGHWKVVHHVLLPSSGMAPK